jgi:MFS family permease
MAQATHWKAGEVDAPTTSEKILFWASFFTLIAAGIGFSVRGAILGDWGKQYGFTQTELGAITGGGLTGFGITIIFFSFLADRIGYGKLMIVAFLLHASSAVVTFLATPVFNAGGIHALGIDWDARTAAYNCLNIGMWLFAFGNGTCEAVINPLTATLFPRNKTHYLNILHAGWPGGLILGAAIVYAFNNLIPDGKDMRWEYKLGVFLVPVLLYGLLMVGRRFPRSEAKASGVSLGSMILALLSPILIFLWLIHAMVGYVELGTDSWITNITETVLANQDKALLAFIWTNLLMFTLRFFAGPIVHKISPLGLLFFSAVLGTAGLYLLGRPETDQMWLWLGAVTIYGLGKTFYWPTMLGVISERFPKGGALALGISGGIGMITAGLLGGPGIGYKQDFFTVQSLEQSDAQAYTRYRSESSIGFPFISEWPEWPAKVGLGQQVTDLEATLTQKTGMPKIAGLDNAKVSVLMDSGKQLRTDQDILKEKGLSNESLDKLSAWWAGAGQPYAAEDKPRVEAARLFGSKSALTSTAYVPATMACCYLLLILFFAVTGGYRQVHIEDAH